MALRASAQFAPTDLRAVITGLPAAREVTDDQRWVLNLMSRHGPGVLNVIWRILGNEADVLDVYQATVCALLARGSGPSQHSQASYFYRSAVNRAIEVLRSRQRRARHWPAVVRSQADRPDVAAPDARPNQLEAVDRLRQTLCHLPDQLRAVIVLRDLAELPYRRVARILGIQVNTARLYRRQAVLRLAELMREDATDVD